MGEKNCDRAFHSRRCLFGRRGLEKRNFRFRETTTNSVQCAVRNRRIRSNPSRVLPRISAAQPRCGDLIGLQIEFSTHHS